MKWLLRKVARFFVVLADRYACDTYGDVAELSDGPCRRCVGHAVETISTDLMGCSPPTFGNPSA